MGNQIMHRGIVNLCLKFQRTLIALQYIDQGIAEEPVIHPMFLSQATVSFFDKDCFQHKHLRLRFNCAGVVYQFSHTFTPLFYTHTHNHTNPVTQTDTHTHTHSHTERQTQNTDTYLPVRKLNNRETNPYTQTHTHSHRDTATPTQTDKQR